MEKFSEKDLRILRLIHLINRMNEDVAWHRTQENPSTHSIQNALELKSRYEKELLEILSTELGIRIPVAA